MAGFHRKSVGKAEVIALRDSWIRRSPDGFFVGVNAGAWEPYREWLDEDGLMAHNYGCFIIRSEARTILVDTGLGEGSHPLPLEHPPSLPTAMEGAGIAPADVDLVLFTHLHWDHTGWNTLGTGDGLELMFPKAQYVVQQAEFDYWTGPGEKPDNGPDFERALAPLVAADQLVLVEGDYAATDEVVTMPTPGHTPGHVSFAITSGSEHAYILGDAVHKPVQLTETDWYPGFDLDPVESTRSRHLILDRAEAEGALLAGGHFAFPSMGYPTQADGFRTFEYLVSS